MDFHPVRSIRRMPRRRQRLLAAGAAALVLVVLAGVSIYRAANDPIVEGDSGPTVALPDTEPGDQADLAPDSVQDLLTAAGGEADTIFGSLPLPGPCESRPVTLTVSSDAPILIGGYLTSTGETAYFEKTPNPSVTLDLCGKNPVGLVVAQASATATFISCSTSDAGTPGESRRQEGPYAKTYCYV